MFLLSETIQNQKLVDWRLDEKMQQVALDEISSDTKEHRKNT